MLGVLRRFAATEPFIVILVRHEINLAAEICDRTLLLDAGRPVREGSPENLLEAR